MNDPTGAWCLRARWLGKPWLHLCWRMLFCKNLGEIRWRRCGGILTTMPDKLTSSEPASAAVTETQQATSAARKIYPIVKYSDPILEKPGAHAKKFDAELEHHAADMLASMYAVQGGGRAEPHIGR